MSYNRPVTPRRRHLVVKSANDLDDLGYEDRLVRKVRPEGRNRDHHPSTKTLNDLDDVDDIDGITHRTAKTLNTLDDILGRNRDHHPSTKTLNDLDDVDDIDVKIDGITHRTAKTLNTLDDILGPSCKDFGRRGKSAAWPQWDVKPSQAGNIEKPDSSQEVSSRAVPRVPPKLPFTKLAPIQPIAPIATASTSFNKTEDKSSTLQKPVDRSVMESPSGYPSETSSRHGLTARMRFRRFSADGGGEAATVDDEQKTSSCRRVLPSERDPCFDTLPPWTGPGTFSSMTAPEVPSIFIDDESFVLARAIQIPGTRS